MFEYRREILAVYRERSFTKAADVLFVSQPALSATVKKAENYLGFEIFDRASRPLRLTSEGEAYVKALIEMERLEAATEQEIARIRGLETGSLVVGGSSLFASLYLPRVIQRYRESYPGIEVSLREGSTDQLFALLVTGEVDVVLDNCEVPSEQFCGVEVAWERLCLAIPPEIAPAWVKDTSGTREDLGSIKPYRLVPADLKGVPLVMLRRGNDTADRFYKLCPLDGSYSVEFQTEQLMTAFNICASGLGATVLSDGVARLLPYDANLLYLPLEGDQACRSIRILHARGTLKPAVSAFIETAKSALLSTSHSG